LTDPIRKALTKSKSSKGLEVQVPPSDLIVYAMYFSIAMVICLTVLEVVHLVILGRWNSEVFASISGLIGTIVGIFLTQKA